MQSKHFMGLFIVAIMVFSIFGFVLNYATSQPKIKWNGYTFIQTRFGWQTHINGKRVVFNLPPDVVDYVEIPESDVLNSKRALTITYDQDSEDVSTLAEAQYYLEQMLLQNSEVYPQRAIKNASGTGLIEASCEDGTPTVPVIELKLGNTTQVTKEGECWVIEAEVPSVLSEQIEKLIYTLIGIA